jgi:hypothetical protein
MVALDGLAPTYYFSTPPFVGFLRASRLEPFRSEDSRFYSLFGNRVIYGCSGHSKIS